jgi:hypothetical protein
MRKKRTFSLIECHGENTGTIYSGCPGTTHDSQNGTFKIVYRQAICFFQSLFALLQGR